MVKKSVFILLPIFIFLIIPSSTLATLININTADLAELDKIPEVGPATASKIIEYRNTQGPFKIIEDIMKVSGIKDATFLKMKDFITVGPDDSSVSIPSNDSQNNKDSTDSNSSSNSGVSNNDSSVHTGETDLSNYKSESLKISAGRERLATVRTPILFSVTQNKKGTDTNYFSWSFGDGTNAYGVKVYHTYQFPGRYNVVLNGSIDDEEEAVARTTVIVSEAKIKITNIDLSAGYVELTNHSDQEQNLNNWSLRTGDKIHTFPLDTIISPKVSLKIPLKAIGLINQEIKEIVLAYPDGGLASGASLQTGADQLKIAELKKQLTKIKRQLAANDPEVRPREIRDLTSGTPNLTVGTTTPRNVVVLTPKLNWFEKIKHAIFE